MRDLSYIQITSNYQVVSLLLSALVDLFSISARRSSSIGQNYGKGPYECMRTILPCDKEE